MGDNRELIADQISAHHKKLVSLTNEEKRLEYRTFDITELVKLGIFQYRKSPNRNIQVN